MSFRRAATAGMIAAPFAAVALAIPNGDATAHAMSPSFIVGGIPGCNFETGEINAGQCIPAFLAHIISTIFAFTGGVFLIMVLYSGYEIVIGSLPGGSSESGKNRLTWSIIGFIVCATAFFLIDFIISAIGG